MKYLHRLMKNASAGFTMIEVLIVVAILAVLSTVVLPPMLGFIDSGSYINRTSIARTIYLAAQNQLTKNRLENSLKSSISGYYFESDGSYFTDIINSDGIDINNVAANLASKGGEYPSADSANIKYVHYISKPKGYIPVLNPDTKELKELNDFYNLLEKIIMDSKILDNAILMEYNVQTGVILSVFYGDAEQTEFIYMDNDDENNINNINNVTGGRGTEYSYAKERKQGYYGAETTGEVQISAGIAELKDYAYVYDGADRVLETTSSGDKINVLYAEFLIVKQAIMPSYTFELADANSLSTVASIPVNLNGGIPINFDEAIAAGANVYLDNSRSIKIPGNDDARDLYNRYIWIIDYIGREEESDETYSINGINPTEVRARAIKSGGSSAVSLTTANTHFFRKFSTDTFEIKSARHLNNIRYVLSDGTSYYFRQTTDIDMAKTDNVITNFPTIKGTGGVAFNGTYNAVKNSDSQYIIRNLTCSDGLFENNAGTIQSLRFEKASITGTGNTGVVAAQNSGTIDKVTVDSSGVSGGNAGGITGINNAGKEIKNSIVSASVVNGSGNAGGICGRNEGTVSSVGAESVTVNGASEVGGIAGYNTGNVGDVYFLSQSDGIPVYSTSNKEGGIAGYNGGSISCAFYYAFAPFEIQADLTLFYPIVRNGINSDKSYFLSGYRHSLDNGNSWIINFYNMAESGTTILGGGRRLVTKFIDKAWISYAYTVDFNDLAPGEAILENWMQVPGYPYPVLRTLPVPKNWPEADSPARPTQVDRADDDTDPWQTPITVSKKAENLEFVNGDFSAQSYVSSQVAANPGSQNRRIYIDMGYVSGWNTRPVNASGFSLGNFIASENDNGNGVTIPRWRLMEFQEPINVTGRENLNDYAYTDYQGNWNNPTSILTSTRRYAELNADVQGTLYQVCTTEPGQNYYYSFYHTTRLVNGATADDMSFYLTPIGIGAKELVENEAERAARDSFITLIRPCRSPRASNGGAITTSPKPAANAEIWNKDARKTVAYGTGFDLSFHRGKSYTQPNGNTAVQNIPASGNVYYLYDVWIGNTSGTTRNGYGITFWSVSNRSLAINGYLTLNDLTAIASEAATQVIGYWGVEYGWKHYYGEYTVPEGQKKTEFAFQSNTGNDTNGNYLDGISFKAPAFVTINKFIKEDGNEVKFVKPNDSLKVELRVENWGEIPADNIIIKDRFSPFDAYTEYIGNIYVEKDGSPITPQQIITPLSGNNYTLSIKLPTGTTLGTNEKIIITFDIKVRIAPFPFTIESGLSTLLYYFKNQAVIDYGQDINNNYKLNAFQKTFTNCSSVLQVYIDPVKLTKKIETIGNTETPDPLINGPFKITLTVENNMPENPIETNSGLVTDIIPKNFKLSSNGITSTSYHYNPPEDEDSEGFYTPSDGVVPFSYTRSVNADGSSRISIKNSDLTEEINKIEYTYELEYIGNAYGVSLNSSTDYRYLFVDSDGIFEVKMDFPQPVVGVSIRTSPDEFTTNTAVDTTKVFLDITSNDMFYEKMSDDEYVVSPTVVLTDASGTPLTTITDHNYYIDNDEYYIKLARGTNNIEFTPKNPLNNTYVIYYKIMLTARKSGGTPETFLLDSPVTAITINYIGKDTPVYYEVYSDGTSETYGFYAGDGVYVPAALDNTKPIIESGYGVMSGDSGRSVQIDGYAASGSWVVTNGIYLYKLNAEPVTNFNLLTVKSGTGGALTECGRIHPNFAKAVYAIGAANAGNTFSIRTPQQMRNIGLIDANGITFNQERGLNFSGIDLNADGSAVKELFKGVYDGGAFAITNLKIESPSLNNVGLFSQNGGTIKNVILNPDIAIQGNDNVGGITGHNQSSGLIENCTVSGTVGTKIIGNSNTDIIAGLNNGTITP